MKNKSLKYGILIGSGYILVKWTLILLFGNWLYRSGYWSNWYLLIVPVLGISNIYYFRKRNSRNRFRKFFIGSLKNHYPNNWQSLVNETDRKFEALSEDIRFSERSGNPLDKRMVFSAYFLALIMVLEQNGMDFEKVRLICLEITYAYVTPKNRFQQWLKRLPPKLIGLAIVRPLLSMFNRKLSLKTEPEGFRAKIITSKSETFGFGYGFDILECGICKLFQKHQAGRYASILCEVDTLTSGLAGLELIRKGTIANGADKCDFRFRKMKN